MTQIQHHVMMPHGLYNEQGFIPVLLAVIHGSLHMLHSQLHVFWFHLCKSRGMAAVWPYGSADPMTSVRTFSSQSGCILMSACCARLGRVWPYRFWLGNWPLRPRMLSTPAGSEGRRKRGVSLLCALCLCVAFTHRHIGGVCASVSSGPSVSRCPIWSGLGSTGLGCVSCGWWMALTWWSLWGLAGCAVGVSHQPSLGSVWH